MAAGDTLRKITPNDQFILDANGNVVGVKSPNANGSDLRFDPSSVAITGGTIGKAVQVASAKALAYTGLVATRGTVTNTFDATKNQYQGKTRHVAMDNITSLQLVYTGWSVTNPRTNGNVTEVNALGSVTLTASIEYPVGTRTQVKFSGSAIGTLAPGATLITDAVSVAIPIGATFYVYVYQQGASGILASSISPLAAGLSTTNNEASNTAVSGLADTTMSGTISNFTPGIKFFPSAIIGLTSRPTFALVGDSRAQGTVDTFTDAYMLVGELERSIGQQFAFINLAVGGERASDFATGAAAKRIPLAAYASHVLCNYGINDLSNSRTSAQIVADIATIKSMLGSKPLYQGTVAPASTSTDSWATTGNQTTATYNAARVTLNGAIRGGSVGDGFFETADTVETARDSGIWKAPGYTTDGVHETQSAFIAVRQARCIDDIVRPLI